MTDLVDQMFPPINRQWAPEFTDLNYWKTPIPDIPLPDLAPPSPALSARSDMSNQSTLARLRHFSLRARTTSSASRQSTSPPPRGVGDRKDAHLRQMSSFERLSSTLSSLRVSGSQALSGSTLASPRTMTPTSMDSDSEDEEDIEQGKPRRRERRRSITSMPGSLPGSSSSDEERFGQSEEDEEDEEDDYGYEGGNEEEVAEEAFDEDLLAAGEMQNVPFL